MPKSISAWLRGALPRGGALPKRNWEQRHRLIVVLLWLHVVGTAAFGIHLGFGASHALLESGGVAVWALAATFSRLGSRLRACAASLGLLTASALFVHLSGGVIEAHFHFFVVIAVVALYQDWLPFLLAIGFVVFEHGVGGVLFPADVYDHPDAWAEPWKWASIHGSLVLAASVAYVVQWRFNEQTQAAERRAHVRLAESQRTLATLMSNLPGMAYRCLNDPNWTTEFVSEGCFDLTGYTPEDFLIQRITFADLIHADDRQRLWEDTQAAVAERRPFRQAYRLLHADGRQRWVWEQGRGVYDASGRLLALEGFVSDMTEQREAELALEHQAHYDALTELPNRVLARQTLEAWLGSGPLALLIMDLDRFKEINDTFGHEAGDQLLRQVGERLRSGLGSTGLLARLGGDEFAILLPGADATQAMATARHLREVLEGEPFAVERQYLTIEGSTGLAVYPDHGADAATLLRHADVAMYQAKHDQDGLAMYDAARDQHSPARLGLASDLRQAIERSELKLHYQPKVDLSRGRVVGVEALLRWQHPQQGFIPPDQFVGLAEQTGLIHPMTLWVLEEALRQHAAWRSEGLHLPVAVNFSMRNLQDPDIADTVAQLLRRWEVPASMLEIEITESSLMADPARALETLRRLRAMGVKIAIDDFGTGYSSLAHLKQLPVDVLKIDRSFVREMERDRSDQLIVRTTVDLAHNLDLRVVAEGVEDRATGDYLAEIGCDQAQGYYFARPLPADDLTRWLRETPPSWPGTLRQVA
jgi:diguanylate cyclase (GGDEF)-like protein/PAS domain S-box-containing protein